MLMLGLPERVESGVTRLEAAQIAFAARNEFVQRLTDLMFISTYWGYEKRWTSALLEPYARELGRHLHWSEAAISDEIDAMLAMSDQPSAS
jgi:glycerol-3-phosphate dehydrogenase